MTFLCNMIQNLIQASKKSAEYEPYYEVLQSIILNGTQYFPSGIYTKDGLTFSGVFSVSSSSTASSVIFGGRQQTVYSSPIAFSGYELRRIFSDGKVQVINGTQSPQSFNVNFAFDTEYQFSMGGTKLTLNNTDFTITQGTSIASANSREIYIGACNADGSATVGLNGSIGCMKIGDNGVLVVDYIPVLDSQMRPCLYDRVSKTFIYAKKISDGTDATSTLTYQRWNKFDVDYIENTGTAYIPFADITPSATMGMNIEYAYTVLSSSEPAGVIGTYNGDTQRKDTFFVSTSSGYTLKASNSTCGVMVFHRGGNVGTSSSSSASYIEPEKDVWYTATVNWLGDSKITWTNGTDELETNVGANAVVTNQLRLFSRCNSSNSTYNNCKSRVRKLQFSDGSNIIRSYKPTVWHNSSTTAIATLYDEVYNKMCTPTGSLKAYITTETTAYKLSDGVQNDDYYLNEQGVKTASADHTSCYSNAFPVKQGDIVEWTVTAEAVSANKRIHGYTTNADIEAGTTGYWVSMLAKIVFSTTSDTTQTVRFTVPSGINYIRVSHANVRESVCDIKITRTYEVGSNCFVSPATASQQVTNNYFNSGLYGNENWNVKLIAFTSPNVAGQLFGNFISSSANNNLTINSGTATGTGTISRFDGQSMSQDKIINLGANSKSLLQMNKIGAWQDSTQVVAWDNPNSFTTTGTCYIGGTNGSATVRPNGCCYLLIEENQTPIAEYIPVKNATVTTEYGLYDRVSGTLNTGIGTITFNALS